jgi:hypothetical protein
MKENSLKALVAFLESDGGNTDYVNINRKYEVHKACFERAFQIYFERKLPGTSLRQESVGRDKWTLRLEKTTQFNIGLIVTTNNPYITLSKYDQNAPKITLKFKRFIVHK